MILTSHSLAAHIILTCDWFQDNFCPVPESTFIPVEPAKEPVSHYVILYLRHLR